MNLWITRVTVTVRSLRGPNLPFPRSLKGRLGPLTRQRSRETRQRSWLLALRAPTGAALARMTDEEIIARTVAAARDRAYEAVARIQFEGCQFRRDIALAAVGAKVESTDGAALSQR